MDQIDNIYGEMLYLNISKFGHKTLIFSSDSSVQTLVIETGIIKSTESFSYIRVARASISSSVAWSAPFSL